MAFTSFNSMHAADNAGSPQADSWFPVVGQVDTFSDKSVVDMSALIEAPAGKYGFLKRDGEDLKFQKAKKPIKFWAVGTGGGDPDSKVMEGKVKWLRKHGINLVRVHTVVGAVGFLNDDETFNKEKLDIFDRGFSIMKKHGIYSTWSVIYPHHGPMIKESYGLNKERMDALKKLFPHAQDGAYASNDFINIDRELQDITLRYFKVLLEHKNPYTGLKYKDDPALAVVEFQNESNVFFHTLNQLRSNKPAVYATMVRKMWFEWLKERYKTKDAIAKAWGSGWDKDDKWEAGEMGLMAPYHWGADGPLYEYAGQFKRAGDYMRFLVDVQKGYYDRREKELRKIGF
ncbi:MAG: beta-galactosidase [Planctomycetes bacterium]|nr:beta-galactosidase [Planctomycetota bacterium]